jgi:hypothetical protein
MRLGCRDDYQWCPTPFEGRGCRSAPTLHSQSMVPAAARARRAAAGMELELVKKAPRFSDARIFEEVVHNSRTSLMVN